MGKRGPSKFKAPTSKKPKVQDSIQNEASYMPIHVDDDDLDDLEVDVKKEGSTSEPVDASGSGAQKKANCPKGRKLKSKVWSHFKKNDDGDESICIYCGITYDYKSRTGNGAMLRHMDVCLKNGTRDVGQLVLLGNNGKLGMSNTFNYDKFRELVATDVVMHELPFQFSEYEYINAIFQYLKPDIQLVSRNTLKAVIFKIFKVQKDIVKSFLEKAPGRINFTSDMWTSIRTDGYITLTAHFIDEEWKLRKYILSFSEMSPPHTGKAIAAKLLSVLDEWGITIKVGTFTLDNASANDTCIASMKDQLINRKALVLNGEHFHLRCCAHILNLIVQDGLKQIDPVIDKIRDSAKYVKGSQARKKMVYECVSKVSLETKKGLRQDVPTRWNATFQMLQNAIYFRTALRQLELNDDQYDSCPSSVEWERVEGIAEFLERFYALMCIFSGTKYPTANLYFEKVFLVYLTLLDKRESRDLYLKNMAVSMLEKFEKYWSNFNETMAITVTLDPRYKFFFVEFAFKKLFKDDAFDKIEEIRKKLFSLYDSYESSSLSAQYGREIHTISGDGKSELVQLKEHDAMAEFDETGRI